ncbi:CHASE3 domain-containing protein [Chenggangzhangella methanolivorans]|uniref:sensor histidine kinase n=1 Tax=Chenggangzhangella methanolivorans TaxID=1437009 RepID=UPI003620ED9A
MSAEPRARRAGRKETLALLLGFAALVAVGGASVWLVARNAAFNEQVSGVLEAKAEIVRVLSLVQDAETGQRGYLLTNDERYLRPYETAAAQIGERLEHLGKLLADEGDQMSDLAKLRSAVGDKLAELAQTVALQRSGQREEALAVVDTERGRNAMLSVRRVVALMTAREDKAFAELSGETSRSGSQLVAFMTAGLFLAAGLAVLAQIMVRRGARQAEEARAAIAEANEGLEAAVAERTSDLIQANEEIQRFAYIVSHDLRAPLVNVMGFTSELDAARKVLKEQIDGLDEVGAAKVSPDARLAIEEDLPEAIGFIRTSTAKMDRLINAILKLSREGSRLIRPESVQIETLVVGIADTMYQQLQAADAEIEVQAGLPAIVTDRLSIEQIFQNLIENAVKYLDRSRAGRVKVTGRRVGSQVEYAIEDNGRGIDAKDHERVFELFRRAGAQDQPGEGLGLAFVRASVRRLGGAIRLTSEPGRGSTFHLTFPAVYQPPSEARA